MNPKLLWLQGGLYTAIAALTPLTTALSSDTPLTARYIACLCIGSFIAGATALKAFLSTNFAESPQANGGQTDSPERSEPAKRTAGSLGAAIVLALALLLCTSCSSAPDLTSCQARRTYAATLRLTAAALDCEEGAGLRK